MSRGLRAMPLLLLALCGAARAEVRLLDEAALRQALHQQPPCCVIDGRPPEQRKARPVAEALPYRADMKINPTAGVVVLADSDERASVIARRIDKAYPGREIFAVKGGYAVLTSVLRRAQPPPGLPEGLSFVIPSNTCEQGAPLQTLIRAAP